MKSTCADDRRTRPLPPISEKEMFPAANIITRAFHASGGAAPDQIPDSSRLASRVLDPLLLLGRGYFELGILWVKFQPYLCGYPLRHRLLSEAVNERKTSKLKFSHF